MKRVEVFVPRAAANDDPNLFVGVNGISYLLPRGKKSKVPEEIAAEFDRANKAQAGLDARVDKLVAESKQN